MISLTLTWLSAELIITAATKIAKHYNVSETFIGLTILSIGTSLPELGTHIAASIKILQGADVSGLAVATNIGSSTIQISAILAIIGLFMIIKTDKEFLRKNYMVSLYAIVLLFIFSLNHLISRFEGFVLIVLYIIYIYYLAKAEHFTIKKNDINNNTKKEKKEQKKDIVKNMILLIISFVILLTCSSFVVTAGEKLAAEWNVGDSLIGISLIGIGTALPELTTALAALKRKSSGMSLGVLVGSNITNPLFALGIGALISGYTINSTILWIDIPVWFTISFIVLLMMWDKLQLNKKDSIILLFLYFLYLAFRIFLLQG